jgi:hypothetical protein
VISLSHRFVFVHIPKTAGNSIRLALEPFCEGEIATNERQARYNQAMCGMHRFRIEGSPLNVGKHAKLAQMHRAWSEDELGPWSSYTKFTCVRNPWDRLVSFYFSPHSERTRFDRDSFVAFITSAIDRNQADFVRLNGEVGIDHFIRFEHLASDFDRLCSTLGISAVLSHVNASRRDAYQGYFDDESRALVDELYRDEIEMFGYSFDS